MPIAGTNPGNRPGQLETGIALSIFIQLFNAWHRGPPWSPNR